jgi:hypothetical protein
MSIFYTNFWESGTPILTAALNNPGDHSPLPDEAAGMNDWKTNGE